ncbi:MAG: hypothetical protein QOH91_3425 [Mycobacterium sp.]|jgi:hypothetical protein|nr:hypothetical protein [Mycobacterium sp.]
MTAALHDEVVVTAAPKLHVVRDGDPIQAPAPKKVARRTENPFTDPLVDGAARLLSVPLRHVYAALWRIGVLEVQG